jgi:hypothetical protein
MVIGRTRSDKFILSENWGHLNAAERVHADGHQVVLVDIQAKKTGRGWFFYVHGGILQKGGLCST